MKGLYKTTIVIWSEYNPEENNVDIDVLAREAVQGDAYSSHTSTVHVPDPDKDEHWDGNEFFFDPEQE